MKQFHATKMTPILSLVLVFCFAAAGVHAGDTRVAAKLKAEKVDLNTASAAALSELPGSGGKKAEAIVQYRTQHGRFKSAEELLQVKGIGSKLLEKIKPMIAVSVQHPDLPKRKK